MIRSRLSRLWRTLARFAAACLCVASLLVAGLYAYGGMSLLTELYWDGSACR
jgi:hypothetical protein